MKIKQTTLLMLFIFVCCPGVAQQAPSATIKVSHTDLPDGRSKYDYRIVNSSVNHVVGFAIGSDYYHGVSELHSVPSGWTASDGFAQGSSSSPGNWSPTLVTTEDSPLFEIEWRNDGTADIAPGQTLGGFSIITPQSDDSYLNGHWTAFFSDSTAASASLVLDDNAPVGVTISPASGTLTVNRTQQFTATVSNSSNTGVTWTINPGVGTISNSGVYTAPASIASQSTVAITATSMADTSHSATATITIMPPISVSITPAFSTLTASQTQQFSATVVNAANTAVTWMISPSVGTISSSGLYAAPLSIPSQQAVTVTATSVADQTKSASAIITLVPTGSSAACQVTFTNSNDWGTGFTASISITNTGNSSLNGWTLIWQWSGNQQITQSWNASYAQGPASVTLSNAEWNGLISSGATVTGIGFNATYSGTNNAPSIFYLNGSPCAGAGVTAPAPPSSLSATALSANEISLSWSASQTVGVTYNVYASTSPNVTASPALRVTAGVSGITFQHQGVGASTTYYYVITAVNGSGESAISNQASATTAGVSCHVGYTVQSEWDTGFTGAISIANTGSSAIQGWTLTWLWPGNQQIIPDAWNATSTQSGSNVTFKSLTSDANISPGMTITGIGFNASYKDTNVPPSRFYLNGVQCN